MSELCEIITVCKWMYSCRHVISVSSQPCEKRKIINKQFTCRLKVGLHYQDYRYTVHEPFNLCTSQHCCIHVYYYLPPLPNKTDTEAIQPDIGFPDLMYHPTLTNSIFNSANSCKSAWILLLTKNKSLIPLRRD